MRAKIPPSAACRNACSTCPGGIGSSGAVPPAGEGTAYGSNSGSKDGPSGPVVPPALIGPALYSSVGKGLPKRKIRVGSRNVSISGLMVGKGMKSPSTFAGAIYQAALLAADRIARARFSPPPTGPAIHGNAVLDPPPGKVVDDKTAAPSGGQSAIGQHHRRGDAAEGDIPTQEAPRAREEATDIVTGIEQGRLEDVVPSGVGAVEPGLYRVDRGVLLLPGQVVQLCADHVLLDEELFERLDEDVEDGTGERETDGVAFRLGEFRDGGRAVGDVGHRERVAGDAELLGVRQLT